MKKIILLFGGMSPEHEISCKSAQFVLNNIDKKKYECTPIVISKEGDWYIYNDINLINWEISKKLVKIENIIETIKDCDVVFPIIHGTFGEDGRIQSLLELFDIKYVGCDSKTSMLCMDKEYTKILANYNGIPIIPYKIATIKSIKAIKKYPVVIKPANGGSSIGIGIAKNKKEAIIKYKEAKKYDNKVIIEEFKTVRELEVAVLTEGKKCYISKVGEILTDGEFYDYENKYITSLCTTPKSAIPINVENKIYEYVERLVAIFNINDMARIDFFYVEHERKIYFNEINTIPGFTEISMYPALMKESKFDPKKIITKLIENS
jgi:D-alanine--D-alanine ligase